MEYSLGVLVLISTRLARFPHASRNLHVYNKQTILGKIEESPLLMQESVGRIRETLKQLFEVSKNYFKD